VGPVTYLWDTGETTPCITKAPMTTTTYTVLVTTAAGCQAVGWSTVPVNPNPSVEVSSTGVCQGTLAAICATLSTNQVGPVSYLWDTGETSPCITKAPMTTTTYTVLVTTAAGCWSMGWGTLTVLPNPVVNVNSPTIPPGGSATLTATVTGAIGPFDYIWSPGIWPNASSITASPAATTTYTVLVRTRTTPSCQSQGTGTVIVTPGMMVSNRADSMLPATQGAKSARPLESHK
jgi:hypothetical protein